MSGTVKTKPWWARARAGEISQEPFHQCHRDGKPCDLPDKAQPRHADRTRCTWWPDYSDPRVWSHHGRHKSDSFEARQDRRKNRRRGRRSVAEGVGDFIEDLADEIFG
jgi:hypothetical protein